MYVEFKGWEGQGVVVSRGGRGQEGGSSKGVVGSTSRSTQMKST